MTIEIRRAGTYPVKPWKNGRGTTADVLLLPPGADHDRFDIRLSLADIVEDAPFSAFPGIERTITVVEGSAFVLDFGAGGSETLELLRPLTFDSALTPTSRVDEAARVLNVMVRRGAWTAAVRVLAGGGPERVGLAAGELAVLYATAGEWRLAAGRSSARALAGDTALVADAGDLTVAGGPGAAAVLAVLAPARP